MFAIFLSTTLGLHLNVIMRVTIAEKVNAACRQLGIDNAGLTVPAALQACNQAMGVEQNGPLLMQADELSAQLGLKFDLTDTGDDPPDIATKAESRISRDAEADSGSAISAANPGSSPTPHTCHAVMSKITCVHKFSRKDIPEEMVHRAMECQFWAPNHKLKGSWRFVQLGPESRLAAATLSAGQAPGKAAIRLENLKHIPGCLVVVCKAFYESADRVEKEEQRALTAVHNLALGFTSQGLAVKWVTGATTENYELWELIGLEPNEEVVVGLLWYGWPDPEGIKPVRDWTAPMDKLSRLP